MEGSYNLHYVLLFAYIYHPAIRFEQLMIIRAFLNLNLI